MPTVSCDHSCLCGVAGVTMEELRAGMAAGAVYGLDFWKDCCREAAAPPKPARSSTPPAARPAGRKAAAKGKGKGKGKGKSKSSAGRRGAPAKGGSSGGGFG